MEHLPMTQEVIAIAGIAMCGDIIPDIWYRRITKAATGKSEKKVPHQEAVIILARIVRWYKPREIRDEKTGITTGYARWFASDMLQMRYSDLEEAFGFGGDTIRSAFDKLEALKLVQRHFRTVRTPTQTFSNVMFVQIFPKNIALLTSLAPTEKELQAERILIEEAKKKASKPSAQEPKVEVKQEINTKPTQLETETELEVEPLPPEFTPIAGNQPVVRTIHKNGEVKKFLDLGNPEARMTSTITWQAMLNAQLPAAIRTPLVNKLLEIHGLTLLVQADENSDILEKAHNLAVVCYTMGLTTVQDMQACFAAWKTTKDGIKNNVPSLRFNNFATFASTWLQEGKPEPKPPTESNAKATNRKPANGYQHATDAQLAERYSEQNTRF